MPHVNPFEISNNFRDIWNSTELLFLITNLVTEKTIAIYI